MIFSWPTQQLTYVLEELYKWELQVWHLEQESARKKVEAKKLDWVVYFFSEIGLQNK